MDRLRKDLKVLKIKNTLEIPDNYLERAMLNIVDVLDHIFSEEAKSKKTTS